VIPAVTPQKISLFEDAPVAYNCSAFLCFIALLTKGEGLQGAICLYLLPIENS